MKAILIASAAAAILTCGYAAAQDSVLTIEPAHRTVIHQYIVKQHIRPVRVKETIALGATLPEDVELQPVPDEWTTEVPEVRDYRYFDWNGKVVFVEPKTRRVVQIVD